MTATAEVCTCDPADLTKPAKVEEVAALVKPIQAAWTARWAAIEKVESQLKQYGFEHGKNVIGPHRIQHDEYEISWVVSESVYYLVTNQREQGGPHDGYTYEDDYGPIKTAPDFPKVVNDLLNSKLLKTVQLGREQIATITVLLAEAYAAHAEFQRPMNELLFGYIHDHIGCFDGVPDEDMEEVWEFVWECRHEASSESVRKYEQQMNENLVALINNLQQAALTAVEKVS